MIQAKLEQLYAAFNARDLDTALAAMHPDVIWPNGMEGGYVYGTAAVRAYWTRQWGVIKPHVKPVAIDEDEEGRVVVRVHQIVRDLSGNVLGDQYVLHIYVIEDGLVRSMEIQKPDA